MTISLQTYLLFLLQFSITAMQLPIPYHAIIVPGLNGSGGDSFVQNSIVNTDAQTVKTPTGEDADLGQNYCINSFDREFDAIHGQQNNKNKKILLYGVSQGAATLINWLSQRPQLEQEKLIGCLFLESPLAKPNTAIIHTLENSSLAKKCITFLPFARVWLPYASNMVLPHYNPLGIQPLRSAPKISPNIPIIIMHHSNDPQLPLTDAQRLYCLLKNKNKTVYFFQINSPNRAHLDILTHDPDMTVKIRALQQIYKNHSLPYQQDILGSRNIDLTEFIPSVHCIEQEIHKAEKSKKYLRNTIDSATALLMGYATYYLKK